MEQLQQNHLYTGIVSGYSSEGLGVLRLEGEAVFVPGAVRGEEVEVRITRLMKNCAAGELTAVRVPSPERREPDCPYFGQCGGCDFRHLSYQEELWAKKTRVQAALTHIGGVDLPVEEILGAAQPQRYRNKCQSPVGADGAVGFFQERTHRVVDVRDCLLQPKAADDTIQAVREWMRRFRAAPYDERAGQGLVRHVCVRTNREGQSLCCVVVNGRAVPHEPELAGLVLSAAPDTAGVLLNTNTARGNVVLGERYRTLWGQDFLTDTLRGLQFRISMPSFYQVNRDQAEVLYGKALEFAGLTGGETALDLYCGIGTITLCLAGRAGRVIGAEIVPQAVADARANAARNGISNAEFFCADASDIAARLEAEGLRPDVITVDPPRKGLAPEVVRAVAGMAPRRVVYVSCDPATLARDIRLFTQLGYRADRAAAVDLFPGTRHVETVVLMSRAKE